MNAIRANQLSLVTQRASAGIATLLPALGRRFGLAMLSPADLGECDGVALWSDRVLLLGSSANTVLANDRGSKKDEEETDRPAGFSAAGLTSLDAETLAAAAKTLGVNRIALLLPAEEFVSTVTPLPGLAGAAALQALKLQATTLIPSYDEPLALIEKPNRIVGTDDYLCLWMTQARLDALSSAFEEQSIELASILPRALLAEVSAEIVNSDAVGQGNQSEKEAASEAFEANSRTVARGHLDQDTRQITQVVISADAPIKWETMQLSDLEEPELAEQWQAELKSTQLAHQGPLSSHADLSWFARRGAINSLQAALASGFTFVPPGELKRRRALKNKTSLAVTAAAILLATIVTIIPFATQSVQFRLAASELAQLRKLNDSARQDQAFVADFDNRWGAVNDYPAQDIIEALFTLQRVISPDTLTGLEIEEGVVTIEGTSNNPQAILQRLEQDPLFTEVAFSRATSNSRYYIGLRLSNISFEGYRARYAQETRR